MSVVHKPVWGGFPDVRSATIAGSRTRRSGKAGRRSGGTAAALSGGLAFLAGAIVTPLTGVLGSGTMVPMAALMSGFFAL